jgi:excisionase family DNA binding protein
MNNPFEVIEARLSNIETLLLDIKHKPKQVETTDHPEQLLTIQQAAEFLSLSVPTLYTKVSRAELPYMKRSKRLYFSRTELLGYLRDGRKFTKAEIEATADQYLINKKKAEQWKVTN